MSASKLIRTKMSTGFALFTVFGLMGFKTLAPQSWSISNWHAQWNDTKREISAHLQKKYEKDATRLALRMISQDAAYHDLDVEVPAQATTPIFNALISIHQSGLEAAKTVTRIHKLHTFPVPSVDHFFVVYNRSAEWAIPLRLGDNTTNSEEINQLLDHYGLVIDKHVEWDEEKNSFHVRATKSLNIAAIAKAFSAVEGVVLVDLLMPAGDGNDIEVKQLEQGLEVNYLVKFGSCISGCKNQHVWSFQVNPQGEVKFLGESGDALPEWMN
ncbi:MAG: hypothetical protein AAGD05_10250 [Bacteroidota bacterium]